MVQDRVLGMFSNGLYCVVAESVDDARELISDSIFGKKYQSLKKEQRLKINIEGWEELSFESSFTLYEDSGGITKTVEDWIRENGRGIFCA